ncbi:MAG: orotidine-5'-phosphate decarboxylase [Elusimicrobia bacterium]|nr:orotidine-5'-phosphate decarboxylase [Elusimicrobiota bacterium]
MKQYQRLIVALDVPTDEEAVRWVERLSAWVDIFKVGPGLFLKTGASLIESIRELGKQVFLDLKLHDIPSVVAEATWQAGTLGVFSLTLHTSGGPEMVRKAAEVNPRPKLWGVTVLTSLNEGDLRRVGVNNAPEAQVVALAQLGREQGLDGVVASVQEAKAIRQVCGRRFTVVTPGIRLSEDGGEQKRVASPEDARAAGADFVVVGRPILEARDPEAVVRRITRALA